jgi:hypothetical protein
MRYIACILFLLTAPAVLASDTHYEDFFIGTRSVGLGGAFVGLGNDPSGLWINPAGLNFARRNDININTSFYGFEFLRQDLGEHESQDTKDAKGFSFFDDLRVIPVTFGGVIGLGKQRPDKTFTHAIAFLFGYPNYSQLIQAREGAFTSTEGEERNYFKHDHNDRTLCSAVGYAIRISDRLSLGFGLFYINRLLDRTDQSIHQFQPAGGGLTEFSDTRTHLVHSSHTLMLNAGVRLDLTEAWSLGLSLHSPDIPLGGDSDLEVIESRAIRDAGGDLLTGSEKLDFVADKVHTRRPLNLRLGFAFEYPEILTVTGDVIVYARTHYRVFNDARVAPYLPMPSVVERQAVINARLGFEYLLFKQMSVALGAFTNFSSAPDIPAQPTTEMLPHIHLFGATLATGYYLKHSLIRLGFAVMYGSGHDVVALAPDWRSDQPSPGFKRVGIDRLTLFAYLATTFRY